MATLASNKPLAIVTGGSSGIGLELAKQLAKNGFDLVIAAEDAGIVAAAREVEQLGAKVEPIQVDLSTSQGVESLYAAARSHHKAIDLCAINAGVGVSGEFARETDWNEELELINLNVVGAVHLAKRVARDMVDRGQGRIAFTSSIAGTMPSPREAVYGATKAFLLSFAESLHHELKDKGVSVTAFLPGPTDTNFFHRAGMDDTKAAAVEAKKNPPEEVARQAYEAIMAGKERVVTGNAKTKLEGNLNKVLPEDFKAKQHAKMVEPGSAPRK